MKYHDSNIEVGCETSKIRNLTCLHFLVENQRNRKNNQILNFARFTVNLDVGAMIFHENKVKYSVTSEKIPNRWFVENERDTFSNLTLAVNRQPGFRRKDS